MACLFIPTGMSNSHASRLHAKEAPDIPFIYRGIAFSTVLHNTCETKAESVRFEAVRVLGGHDERAEIEALGRDITMGQKRAARKGAPFIRAFPDPAPDG
jgi:hypothetical protein